MTNVRIENIIAHAQIADILDIDDIANKIPEFNYNPDDFKGLTWKLNDPKIAVLIVSNGKIICTGAKKIEDAEGAIQKALNKMKAAKIKVKSKPKIEIQNIIASGNVNKELHLSSISKGLIMENINYEPEEFPGLICRMDDLEAIAIVFSSGKIVSTGTKTVENATRVIESMKEKLSSLGAL